MGGHRRFATWLCVVTALASATRAHAAPPTAPQRGISVGTPQHGHLTGGFALPTHSRYVRLLPTAQRRKTNWGHLELAALLVRAARQVWRWAPGARLVVGDLSAHGGGRLRHHRSHTAGRDADVAFYVVDGRGRPVEPRRLWPFDASGRCAAPACSLHFDVARNWLFVRTLLASRRPTVQYIFVARPLRALLLRWARSHGESAELLRRAARVLHQPTDSSPHDNHFHVRIYCSAHDRALGCRDSGPRWPWVGRERLR